MVRALCGSSDSGSVLSARLRTEPVGSFDASELVSDEQREQVELQLEVQAKYAGYIDRQELEIAKHAKQEALRLPADIDYSVVDGLSNEARLRTEPVG